MPMIYNIVHGFQEIVTTGSGFEGVASLMFLYARCQMVVTVNYVC